MEESEQHYLAIGTEVSAKYRGAFCEAKIKTVKKNVMFKVSNKKDGKSYNIPEESIRGQLKIGATVDAQFPEQNAWSEGVIVHTRDKSSYTVEFDDGDVRTLQRGSLCLQGLRHFAESETLDHLPLTDPENFGTPVLSAKRKAKRKTPQSTPTHAEEDVDSDDHKSSDREPSAKRKLVTSKKDKDDDCEEQTEEEKRKKWLADALMGKLVLVEPADKRKHWYPAVCVNPLCYEDVDNLPSTHITVRSFKNGKLFAVERCGRLTKNNPPSKVDAAWKDVLEGAFTWEETGILPDVWRTDIKDILDEEELESDENDKNSVAEETEKNHDFLEQLYKFMEDRGTPMNKTPVLGYKDLDLFLLYNLVQAKGGFHAIVSLPVWREIYCDLGIPKVSQAAGHHAKQAYTKYLLSFEEYLMSFKANGHKERRSRRSDPPPVIPSSSSSRSRDKKLAKALSMSSGRTSPITRSDEDVEGWTRRSNRRRKISETVTDESDITTPPKEVKRGRRSRNDADARRDSDMDDASSTASSEKSTTTRGRLASMNESQKMKIADRRRSNSATRRSKGLVYKAGDKIKVKYGKDSFKIYNAKVVDVDFDDGPDIQYYVHYNGWNSRHDEWIKAWQIVACLVENDSSTQASPAPGKCGRRPRTPTLEVCDKKRNSIPTVNSFAASREEVSGISQSLNFSSPASKAADKDDPEDSAKKKIAIKPDPDAGRKPPTKGRTRRQSTSSSAPRVPAESSTHCAKRAASEEKVLPKRASEGNNSSPKEKPIKTEIKTEVKPEVKSTGRISPPLIAAARRMSNRRSKSPYLKESSLYVIPKKKGPTVMATPARVSPPPVVRSPTPTDDVADRVSDCSSKESFVSCKSEADVSESPKLEEVSDCKIPEEENALPAEEPSESTQPVPEQEEINASPPKEAYDDNFDEEAPVIALEKPKPASPLQEQPESITPNNEDSVPKIAANLEDLPETDLNDEDAAPAAEDCTDGSKSPEKDAGSDSKSNADSSANNISSANTTDNEEPIASNPSEGKEATDESITSEEGSSSSDSNRRPSDDVSHPPPPTLYAPPPPPPAAPPVQLPRPVLPQGAPSNSQVLLENTPPTTPEASPGHFYDDQDTNGESDNADIHGSGTSSLSGEAPVSSSSPDYPPKDECHDDDMEERDVTNDDDGEAGAAKRKCRKAQGHHRRSSGKADARRKAHKSAAGDSETDDDAPSNGKGGEDTPTKGRRRPGKRKTKCKPEPPSAPPPVVGAELAKMDPDERIRVLQAKLSEMRKVYQQLKQEVSSIDRKRKRAKRREQEAADSTSPSTHNRKPSSPSKRDYDDAMTSPQHASIENDIARVNGATV